MPAPINIISVFIGDDDLLAIVELKLGKLYFVSKDFVGLQSPFQSYKIKNPPQCDGFYL